VGRVEIASSMHRPIEAKILVHFFWPNLARPVITSSERDRSTPTNERPNNLILTTTFTKGYLP
jgi:hypothetical protein